MFFLLFNMLNFNVILIEYKVLLHIYIINVNIYY